MTRLLDLDPVLVEVNWRENIHLEMMFDVSRRSNGTLRDAGTGVGSIEVDPSTSFAYVSRINDIYERGPLESQVIGHAVRPYGFQEQAESIQFVFAAGNRMFIVPAQSQTDGTLFVSVNITTFYNRKEMPDGTWTIYPLLGGVLGAPARFDLAKHTALTSYARVFKHTGDLEAYTVTFGLSKDVRRPEIQLATFHFERKGASTRALRRRRRMRQSILSVWKCALQSVFRLARLTRSSKTHTILFASELRSTLDGNLKAVHDRMIERGLDSQFRITRHFWVTRRLDIKRHLLQAAHLARAHTIVIDDFFPTLELLKLDASVEIIQAWHAGVGFKSVGYSRFGNLGSPSTENAHRKYTWAIAGSQRLIPIYADVFGIEPSAVIPTGLPRIDTFLNAERRDRAQEAFHTAHPEVAGRKLILFAPTFRGNSVRDAYYDMEQLDFDALYEFCGEDTVIGFRMHHFIRERLTIPQEYADRFIDLSHYPDGLGLLHSTYLLITDYSSIIYEFSLLDRPMLFFAYDRDQYAATRGFQKDYEESAPGKVCLNSAELIDSLRNQDYEQEKVAQFREQNFYRIDTNSSDRFIDWFFLGKMPQEFSST